VIFDTVTTRELLWAVELNVAYYQYLDLMRIREPKEEHERLHLRQQWIKTCVRLGADAAHRIVSYQRNRRLT